MIELSAPTVTVWSYNLIPFVSLSYLLETPEERFELVYKSLGNSFSLVDGYTTGRRTSGFKLVKAPPTMTIPEKIEYLYTIKSVRETNSSTIPLIESNELLNFDVDLSKLDNVVDYVIATIKDSFPTNESLLTIPIHGRFQHFGKGNPTRLTDLIELKFRQELQLSDYEICKRLIDLFIISVLLDAGAGNEWKFTEPGSGLEINRSEGIAVASFHMFLNGDFSSNPKEDKLVVCGSKLRELTGAELGRGFQIGDGNPINGFEGRLKLLNRLGDTLIKNKELFCNGRPGDLVDYLKGKSGDENEIDIEVLWNALMKGLLPIWPTEGRTIVDGYVIGDAWPLKNKHGEIVTFHKLTQWLTYSLFKPLMEYGNFKIVHAEYMTGLPEYRNGGLFVDFEVLQLKKHIAEDGMKLALENGLMLPTFKPDDDVIVEWRSCTICLLDRILPMINAKMGISGTKFELTLPQLIEAGSWKSGRLIAADKRSNGGPPIELLADGTVF